MSKTSFKLILIDVNEELSRPTEEERIQTLPCHLRLMIFLHFLRTGAFYETICSQEWARVRKGTVAYTIAEVAAVMAKKERFERVSFRFYVTLKV